VHFVTASNVDTVVKTAIVFPENIVEAKSNAAETEEVDKKLITVIPEDNRRPVIRQ
jgi:hypothetical protein